MQCITKFMQYDVMRYDRLYCIQHTDHGLCADPHVYKQTQIYETVPRLSTCNILPHRSCH